MAAERVYWDPTARNRKGGWRAKTVRKRDPEGKVICFDAPVFVTQAEANESVGIPGGSTNPNYRPGEDDDAA